MAATIIEEQNCRACGVDIREGALFCYNCGGSIKYDDPASSNDEPVSDAWFSEDIAEENTGEDNSVAETVETKNAVRKKRRLNETARLRSAAALRRKSSFQKKKIEEVVWEEHENPSNGWFIAVAVVLTILTAAIFLLAIYLK